jgi:chromosome partitioning protein
MKVLATYNIKGGVGKTSAAVNLAVLAAQEGLRTLLWDLDPQGAATFLMRIKPRVRGGARELVRGQADVLGSLKGTDIEGLDLLPADFDHRHMDLALSGGKRDTARLGVVLEPLVEHYDVAMLDCPPSISLVSENVFEAADALLVPMIPTTLSLRTYEQLVRFVVDEVGRRPEIIPFFSMVDLRRSLHREVVGSLPAHRHGIAFTSIPVRADVEQMGRHRAPVASFAPRGSAARSYADLWAEVRERVGLPATEV